MEATTWEMKIILADKIVKGDSKRAGYEHCFPCTATLPSVTQKHTAGAPHVYVGNVTATVTTQNMYEVNMLMFTKDKQKIDKIVLYGLNKQQGSTEDQKETVIRLESCVIVQQIPQDTYVMTLEIDYEIITTERYKFLTDGFLKSKYISIFNRITREADGGYRPDAPLIERPNYHNTAFSIPPKPQPKETPQPTPAQAEANTLSSDEQQSQEPPQTQPPVFKNPNTIQLDEDTARKPKIEENKVYPLPGTRDTDDPFPIRCYAERNKTDTKKGKDGNSYTVTRDENGFPIFTIFETYLLADEISHGDKKKHFKECNHQVKALLEKDPTLKDELGLTDKQYKFFINGKKFDESPPKLSWHHHQDVGKMQLVNRFKHREFGHTGGMAIWGGKK